LAAHPQSNLESLLDETGKLVRMVEGLARIVEADARALAVLEERGRTFRQELGAALDGFAKQRSQSLGWAGTIAERRDYVRSERNSGAHPITQAEAMLWEQAALEHEEERAYEEVEGITERIHHVQQELAGKNEDIERELDILTAQLDGHIAALRSLAVEAWMSLDQVASAVEVDLQTEALQGDVAITTAESA